MEKDTKKIEELEQIHAKFLGRPTKYTEELGAKICDMVATGKTIPQIEKESGVNHASWYLWKDIYPEFATGLIRARQMSINLRLDKLATVMDDDSRDVLFDPVDGHMVINNAAVTRDNHRSTSTKAWLGYQRSLNAKGIAAAKTADDVMQLVQDKLESGDISYEEAEKLAKLAETRMRITDQTELKPMLQEALDKLAKHEAK